MEDISRGEGRRIIPFSEGTPRCIPKIPGIWDLGLQPHLSMKSVPPSLFIPLAGSPFLRRFAHGMEYPQNLQTLSPDSVGDDVGKVCHHQFSRPMDPTRPPHRRMPGEKCKVGPYGLCEASGRLMAVFGDVRRFLIEILESLAQEPNLQDQSILS